MPMVWDPVLHRFVWHSDPWSAGPGSPATGPTSPGVTPGVMPGTYSGPNAPSNPEEVSGYEQAQEQATSTYVPPPPPDNFSPVTRTIDSLHTDAPDKEGLRPVADAAKKVAKMYSQITGGRALLPDVHLALVMSGLPMNQIETLLRSEPEKIAQVADYKWYKKQYDETGMVDPTLGGDGGEAWAQHAKNVKDSMRKSTPDESPLVGGPFKQVFDKTPPTMDDFFGPEVNTNLIYPRTPTGDQAPLPPSREPVKMPEAVPSNRPRPMVASTALSWIDVAKTLLDNGVGKSIEDIGKLAPDMEAITKLAETSGVEIPTQTSDQTKAAGIVSNITDKTKEADIEPTAKGGEATQPKETTVSPAADDTWGAGKPQNESGVAPTDPTIEMAQKWSAEHPTEPMPDWVINKIDAAYPIYPSYIADAMAEADPALAGISQGSNREGEVTGWGGDKVTGAIASIVPTAEGQQFTEVLTGELPEQKNKIVENTKKVNDNITYLEDQKSKALSGDYVVDDTTIPTIDAEIAKQKDLLNSIGSTSKALDMEIAEWQSDPVGRYKKEMDSQIKETYLAGESMNVVFGEEGYGKRMVTDSEAAERESRGERVTRFNEPIEYADMGMASAGSYIGYVDDYGDDENIEYRRKNYDLWQRKGAQMLPDNTIVTHVGVEKLKETYDVNNPDSKSERVAALQKRLNTFVGADGKPLYPVAVTGRLDDPYTEMAVNQLAYDRAAIFAALPTTDQSVKDKAKAFIDSYNKTYAAKVIDLDPNISSIEVSNDQDLVENAPNLTAAQREQYAGLRKEWATKLQPLTTRGVLGEKSFFENWDVNDEYRFDTLPEVSAVKNSDFMYIEGTDETTPADEMLFERALRLRNPNVPESEFSVWWLNNVGEDSMPKQYRDLYNKSQLDEMLQNTATVIAQIGEGAGVLKQDISDTVSGTPYVGTAVTESLYAAQSIHEAIASFKPFGEDKNSLGDVAGKIEDVVVDDTASYLGKAVGGIGEGFGWISDNFIQIPATSVWLAGVASTEYLNDKITDVYHDPFSGYTYSDQNLGSLRDFAVMWKNSYEEAIRINKDTSGEKPTHFMPYMMDYYGYPTEKEPILPFLADLVFEVKGLKLLGAPLKIMKADWGVPAATKLGMKLPFVSPLTNRVVDIGKVADDAGVLARKVDDIYDVMPGLRKLEYAPLAEQLRYVDDVDEAKTLIAEYATKNPAAGDVVSLFEDSLTGTVINQAKMRAEDSRVGGKIAPVIRGLMRPTPTTTGDEIHHIRDPFDTITQSAQSAYYSRKDISKWNGRLHELLGTSGTPQAATEQVLNEMLDDIYMQAGKKHFSHLNPLAAAKKVKADIATYTGKQPEITQLPSKIDDGISYPTSMVGGKKSSEFAAAEEGAAAVATAEAVAPQLDDIAKLTDDAIEELETMGARAVEETAAHQAVQSSIKSTRGVTDDIAERAVAASPEIRTAYQEAFTAAYTGVPEVKTSKDAFSFARQVSKLGDDLNETQNAARIAGLNPLDDPEFIKSAAAYQAMVTSARKSEWWIKGWDLDYLHNNFITGEAAKLSKSAAAKEKQWALTQRALATQQHSPFFSFQMPTYSHHPIRPAVAYLKHGPNGTFMRMLNNKATDTAMRAWRSAVLFGLGTQVRIMSDEGGRLLDQGIGIDALMGLGKYSIAKDLPYWVKGMGGYRSDFEKYVPKMFDEMGGTTGKPYTKNALNWLFTNLSGKSNETGGLMEKWLVAERAAPGSGKEVLRKFAISTNMRTSFSSGLPQEIAKQQRGAYVRLQEMTNRVGVGANVKWAKEADNFFRNDLGLGKGDKIDNIMERFIAAGKNGKSGNLSEVEFTMLTDGGTKLPRIIAPTQFVAENPNAARRWVNTAENGVSKLFTPLEIMNGQVKAGFFRQGYVQKYEAILKANGGSLPRELDKQLAHEAATRAGTRFMEENVYSGFKTAFEYQYRNVMPFGSAYRDFLTYWGKAFATKPTHAAYASYLNMKLEENADAEFPMERALAQKIGFDIADSSIWSFKPSSMTFLTGGSGGFVPAVGPVVTVPLAYARGGLEKLGFDTDWIGEIPMLSFSDPGMAMFSKINKLVYGLSGQKFVQDAVGKFGIEYDEGFNLPHPFGPKKESVDSKINDAIRMEYYRWVKENKRQPNLTERAELEQRGRDAVETDFLVEFLGQYMSPAGFQQTNEAENIARALTLYRNAKPSEREQVRLFLAGESDTPPDSIAEYNAKPLDDEGLEIFNTFIEISKLPDKHSPIMQTTRESVEDMLADHPEMIPFFTGKTERLSDGRTPVTTNEKQNAYTQSVVEVSQLDPSTFAGKIGDKLGDYIGKKKSSVLSQRAANQTETSFNGEITAYAKTIGIENPSTDKAKIVLDQILYPGTNESWESRRKRLQTDNEYGNLSADDKAIAAQSLTHGGVGQLPDKDIRLIAEGATFVGEKINTATTKRLESDMSDWGAADFAAAGKEVSNQSMMPWSEANRAEITITARMKAEQGETITFSSKAGKAYAAELDAFIDNLAAENPIWAEQYALAKGPRWKQMQALGYGSDDPNTKGQWDAAYAILGDMTNKMTDAKSAAEKSDIYKAAMAEIDKLKAENEAFSKQFAILKDSTTKPSTAQLRAWQGDYTKNGTKSYKSKAKGIRKGSKGKKAKRGKRGGGIKAVKRFTGKKKLRVRRPT